MPQRFPLIEALIEAVILIFAAVVQKLGLVTYRKESQLRRLCARDAR